VRLDRGQRTWRGFPSPSETPTNVSKEPRYRVSDGKLDRRVWDDQRRRVSAPFSRVYGVVGAPGQ
jgi:hypothetical protein